MTPEGKTLNITIPREKLRGLKWGKWAAELTADEMVGLLWLVGEFSARASLEDYPLDDTVTYPGNRRKIAALRAIAQLRTEPKTEEGARQVILSARRPSAEAAEPAATTEEEPKPKRMQTWSAMGGWAWAEDPRECDWLDSASRDATVGSRKYGYDVYSIEHEREHPIWIVDLFTSGQATCILLTGWANLVAWSNHMAPGIQAATANAKEMVMESTKEESNWSRWFTKDGVSWRCIRHGFQDAEGGLCPSCARYACTITTDDEELRGQDLRVIQLTLADHAAEISNLNQRVRILEEIDRARKR